jgi:hypothetical protein
VKILGLGRSLLIRSFIAGFDKPKVAAVLSRTVEWKQKDQNMNPREVDRMWSATRRAEKRWT